MRFLSPAPFRPLFVFLALLLGAPLAAQLFAAQQAKSSSPGTRRTAAARPATDQEQFVAYWTSETGWNSELQLRNNTPGQNLTITPVLRLASGEETSLAPVSVAPQEVKSVDVGAAISAAGAPQLIGTYGSVVLRYRSPYAASLYAAMMIRKTGHAVAFHIDAIGESQEFQSGSREGVWWLPKNSASDYLIVANQGKDTIPLDLSLFDANGKESKQKLLLGPAQTTRYSVRQLLQAAGLGGSYGGVKIATNSHSGSLNTLHFLFDETAGFSAILKMFDYNPQAKLEERDYARTGAWTLRAPMLALSNPDAALAFPPGTILQPQLFLRNNTGKPLDASLRFNWRVGSSTGKTAGPHLRLNPFETRRIDVAALQDGNTLPKQANWASVTLTTNGNPDELVAVAASYDATLRYGAQTPFSDQLTFKWEGGMWEFDPYHNSIITAGNGGTEPTRAAFTLFYNQGTQKYELEQTLQPDEQMWVDVGKLIREHVPDKDGKTLPADLTSGSYEFRDLTHKGAGRLFEGKVVYDKTYGHVAYGCAACCGYDELATAFAYDPLQVIFNSIVNQPVDAPDMCQGGALADVSDSFYNNWSTANTAVVRVDSYGNHTGVGVGSTTSQTWGWLNNNDPRLRCPLREPTPSGGDNVKPQITSISPSRGLIGATTSVTLSGSGFGTNPTVNAGSSITVTINSANDTQIQASFAASNSATAGNYSVTVTASGQPSNSTNFFVQVPTAIVKISSQVISMTSMGCLTTDYGIVIATQYQVYDQGNYAIQSANMEPQEKITNIYYNGIYQGDQHPNWVDIGPSQYAGTSKYTDSNGHFIDAPFGVCSTGAFIETSSQPISMLVNGINYTVRTMSWTIKGTAPGMGSATNGADISLSH